MELSCCKTNGGSSGPQDDHPAGTRIQIDVDSIEEAIQKDFRFKAKL
jgi:hypothetical protein